MSHDCAVPAGGTKKIRWKCPVCRTVWKYDPKASAPGFFGALFGSERNRDGSKPSLLRKDQR